MIAIMSTDFDLADLGASLRSIEAGTNVFRRDDTVRAVHQVASGQVRLTRHVADGRTLILQRAGPGELLAEASLFADRYHCDAVAEGAVQLLTLDREMLRVRLAERPDILMALTGRFAREIQRLRARLELAGLVRVADRLDAWLALHGDREGRPWRDVAIEIGVSPEALYRELGRRRRRTG